MDIGLDTTSATMSLEQARLQRVRAEVSSPEQAGRNPAEALTNDRAGLERVAKQFESLYFGQLIKSMRETVPDNGFWGQGEGTKVYRQLHDQALADRLADGGGLGISDMIVRQLEHTVGSAGAVDRPDMIGPAAPDPRGVQAYRSQGEAGERIAGMVRLRRRAEALGGAVADSLERYQREIAGAAEATNLDPALILAVVVRESGGDPGAVSNRGAQGLMQLMPDTARELGVDDAHDPGQNLRGGARYLARMLDRYAGDLDLALAAYNSGPGTVDRAGGNVPDYPETQRYVATVRALAEQLGGTVGTNLDKGTPK